MTVLIPHGMDMGDGDVPPGWSYNPSTWTQRLPIIALALVGFLASRYQLDHITNAWDPFFGNGTERVPVGYRGGNYDTL